MVGRFVYKVVSNILNMFYFPSLKQKQSVFMTYGIERQKCVSGVASTQTPRAHAKSL